MLTSENNLNQKENQFIKRKYISIDLDNDIIDFANPSRILVNKMSCTPFWPEYNSSNKMCLNNNDLNEYDIEKVSCKYTLILYV